MKPVCKQFATPIPYNGSVIQLKDAPLHSRWHQFPHLNESPIPSVLWIFGTCGLPAVHTVESPTGLWNGTGKKLNKAPLYCSADEQGRRFGILKADEDVRREHTRPETPFHDSMLQWPHAWRGLMNCCHCFAEPFTDPLTCRLSRRSPNQHRRQRPSPRPRRRLRSHQLPWSQFLKIYVIFFKKKQIQFFYYLFMWCPDTAL